MEDIKKKKYSRLVVFIILPFTSIVFVFWLIFYSVQMANFTFSYQVRTWYQSTIWKIKDLFLTKEKILVPFNPVYTFQVQKWQNRYAYSFIGKFRGVDQENGFISLLGYNNKTYTFKVSKNFATLAPQFNFNSNYSPIKDKVLLDNPQNFTDDTDIMLYWDDIRTLKEILRDYSTDSKKPLNNDSNDLFYLIKSG